MINQIIRIVCGRAVYNNVIISKYAIWLSALYQINRLK